MSKLIAQLPTPALPSAHPEADAGRVAAPKRTSNGSENVVSTDVAELSLAARRRLAQASRTAQDGVSNAQALARQVADHLHQGTESGALHHVAVGTIARLLK